MKIYENKYLPIGSIVILNKEKEKRMIVGYLPGNYESDLYDYVGCQIDNGINKQSSLNKDYIFFNESDIKTVVYLGYQNNDYKVVSQLLYDTKNKISEFKTQRYNYRG